VTVATALAERTTAPPVAAPPSRRRGWVPGAFLAPALIAVAALTVAPLIYGIYLSFTDWSLMRSLSPHLEGVQAYRDVLSDPDFWPTLLRTCWWTLGTLVVEIVVAVPLALLLNIRTKVTGAVTGLIMLPWITPFIVLSYAWVFLFDGGYGPLHALLRDLHLVGAASPLAEPHQALWAVVLISGWKGVPFLTIALLAVRKGIPDELYEAAAVDGAGVWSRFRHVTWPVLTPTLMSMSVVLGVQAFYSFDLVWLTTQGGPGTSSQILGVELYQAFFTQAAPGRAAAMGALMLVLLLALILPVLRSTARRLD
jgi:ABC-type sugar transport system permease subunit